jgi:Ca2+-binding RTX toxin-like protein
VNGSALEIVGYPGATNAIDVRFQASAPDAAGALGPRFLVDDTVGANALGSLCFRPAPETASCDATAVTGITAYLQDGSDVLAIASEAPDAVPAIYPATIRGGIGDDIVKAGLGDDDIDGEAGKDTLAGGPGADEVSGGPGYDGLIGFEGDDSLFGGAGDDALFGQKGRDRFRGGNGRDVLVARDGKPDRRLDCGPGKPERALIDREDPRPTSCEDTREAKKPAS